MSRYDKLREAFSAYRDAELKYVRENQNLALLIVNGFRDYLEMPGNFPSKDGDVTTYKSYTPFYNVDDDGNTEEANTVIDALSHQSDGTLKFAFGVILEVSAGAFPKRNLIMHVECKRVGKKVAVDVSGQTVDVTFDGENCPEVELVHEMIFNQVIDWLKHRPGDGHGMSKVGFEVR